MGKTINAGWSTKSITPHGRRVSLMGQFYERITEEVESELTAAALAMDNGESRVTWVSCDLGNVSSLLSEDVRALVKKRAPELNTGEVVISVTHTHTAPYIKMTPRAGAEEQYQSPPGVMGPEEYHNFAAEAIADAVIQANREKSSDYYMHTGVSPVQTGCCRRGIIDSEEAVMYIDTTRPDFVRMEGPDGGPVHLLFIRDGKDALKGVIACIPCTAQVLEHQFYMSSDYIGRVRDRLKEKYGDDFLFFPLISSTGNLSPRNLVTRDYGYGNMYDRDGADHMGERVFRGIIAEESNPVEIIKDFSTFKFRTERITLPGWLPSEEEVDWALSLKGTAALEYNIEEYVQKGVEPYFRTPLALNKRVNAILTKHAHREAYAEIETEIAALRIGNVAWVSNAFELYQEYANRMVVRAKARPLWSIQKTYDHMGYLATADAAKTGGYSGFIANGLADPEKGGNKLIEESVKLVNSFF